MKRQWIVVAAIGVALTGCATIMRAPDVEYSGFLTDYSLLEPGGEDQAQLRFVNPHADFSKYDKIFFERVNVWHHISVGLWMLILLSGLVFLARQARRAAKS